MSESSLHKRKSDHIDLAFLSQVAENDNRFIYEPALSGLNRGLFQSEISFGTKVLNAPIWISSMTGGAEKALLINTNLAKAAKHFGLGMGLGSCRPILNPSSDCSDFKLRELIGDQPLFGNLGIAQLNDLMLCQDSEAIITMLHRIEADGLIIHINPLQEWFQPEGDSYQNSPLEVIKWVLSWAKFPVIVKEVGQGMGPKSISGLLQLPLLALDFGALGGTNFSFLENQRREDLRKDEWKGAVKIGHTSYEMVQWVNEVYQNPNIQVRTQNIIVSGGVKSFLDGYYFTQELKMTSIYAQASQMLKYALQGEKELFNYIESQLQGLNMAHQFLSIRK